MVECQFYIIHTDPELDAYPIIATIGQDNADKILEEDFDGEGTIIPVSEKELVEVWGFDLQQVLNDHKGSI